MLKKMNDENPVTLGGTTREGHENASDAKQESEKADVSLLHSDPFHVDTGLIPQACLDDQSLELQSMGLSVFNQDDLEQGIMDQVDRALAKEEEIRYKKILEKELKLIDDDIALAKADLKQVNAIESSLENLGQVRDTSRQEETARSQKENKLKQLKTLKVRQESIKRKLDLFLKGSKLREGNQEDASCVLDQAMGITRSRESEKERLIRIGGMTPFGTVVRSSSPKKSLSGYEQALLAKEPALLTAQKHFNKYLKKKKEQALAGIKTQQSTDKSHLQTPREMKRKCRLKRKLNDEVSEDKEEDEDVSAGDDDEDEYHPSQEEYTDNDDDGEYSENSDGTNKEHSASRKRKKKILQAKKKKLRPLPKYRGEEIENLSMKVKRDPTIRREHDDADPEAYNERLLKLQKKKKKDKEKSGIASSTDEDGDAESELDGGFHVPKKLWKKLFPYQKTGVRWLWELHCQQAGGIIGDEMGLGKTIQTIAFLAALKTNKVKNVNFPYKGLGPTIIVCPTTVMHQWLKEFHKWWPDFRVAILHSSSSFSGSECDLVRSIARSHGILITSYNTLVIQQELVLRFNWHYVILDEGHKIRNPDAKVTLCCKQFRTPHRIILSGSPIQNNLKELWSLFDFVFPGKLGTLPDFMQHFSIPIVQGGYSNASQVQVETAYRCACVLRDTINPYLIRRMKADVKKGLNLPNKNEQVLFCRLTDEQREVYQEYLDSRQCQDILKGKFQVFVGLITLRKICNHPDLSTGGPQVLKEQNSPLASDDQFGYYKRSGKMIVVEALLRLWHRQQHRVLLFTQSKSMLMILEKFVQEKGYTYLMMDGGTSIPSRQPLISQYNNDPSIYLFLLTTRVGGLGVNLTGADRVIIFDPDWNPSTDIQARERAWRIGQTRQVTIYRLLTSGTIEEKIYHRQIFKQFLTNRILKDPKQRRFFKTQDMTELFTLGSQENKEGTETSALFAGTGSDVKVPKKKRRNRFDEMLEKRERMSKVVEKSDLEEDMDLDQEEMDRMKELARRLSRQMEENKKKKLKETAEKIGLTDESQDHLSPTSTQPEANNLELPESLTKPNDCKLDLSLPSTMDSHCEPNLPDNIPPLLNLLEQKTDLSSLTTQKSGQADLENNNYRHRWQRNGKIWTIPIRPSVDTKDVQANHICDPSKSQEETKLDFSPLRSDSQSSRSKEKKHSTDKRTEKQKKKNRHHDARFEGEKIPHLVKHCPLPQNKPEDNQPATSKDRDVKKDKHEDDYVLRQLFRKTGIQGAMKHDKIMDSSRPDYAIVEAEAEKVAREAAAALKRSRQMCSSALSGLPNWTGQSGAVTKPRFGQKKNSLLMMNSKTEKSVSTIPSASNTKKNDADKSKLFDGSISGIISLSSQNEALTSNDLLFRIKARKRISSLTENGDDDFLRPDQPLKVEKKDEELLADIRSFVAFMGNTNGQATTQEIVLNFGQRLPKADAPKFKAMLSQICDFHAGVWRLKTEFR